MSNTLITPSMIAKEALMVLKNNLPFTRSVYNDYTPEFSRTPNGWKVGQTVNVAVPPRYTIRSGANISLQNVVEPTKAIQLNNQVGVDMTFTSVELTQSLSRFSEYVVAPAVAAIANRVETDGLALARTRTFNQVGTPGTTTSALADYLTAGAVLTNNGCPRDNMRYALMTPTQEAATVDASKGFFNSQTQIAKQYEAGSMYQFAGFKGDASQNLPTHQVGPLGGTPLVNGAGQGITTGFAETGTLVTDGWTAAAALRLRQGDVFTIAGVFAVNPQNRQSTGRLQQFVALSDTSSDASGNATISIAPAIISAGQFQNVSNAPGDNQPLTVVGAANTSSPLGLVYHKNAFAFVSRPLEMPNGVDFAAVETDPDTGISIRVVRQYAIGTDTFPCRLDVLYGWRDLYPEWACRLAN
jgi:hypothetical protein